MSDITRDRGSRAGFSAATAAFEGFAIVRRDPKAVIAWTVLMLLLTLGGTALSFAMLGATSPSVTALPARAALMARAAPLYLVGLVVSVVLYGVIYAAVNRTVLRPGSGGVGAMRLGGDELRQMGLLLAIWIGLTLVGLVLALPVGLAGAALWSTSRALAGLLIAIGVVLWVCAMLFLLVRLSLLSPLAFDQRRIDVAAAWRLTRGRFWPLLGAFALAGVVSWVIVTVASTLGISIGMAAMGGPLAMASGDPAAMAPAMLRMQMVNVALTSATYGLIFALMIGAPARAYAEITRSSRAAEVFGPAA